MKLTPSEGEDFAQDALLAVLKGLEIPSAGRHPRPVDVADRQDFIKTLAEACQKTGWQVS